MSTHDAAEAPQPAHSGDQPTVLLGSGSYLPLVEAIRDGSITTAVGLGVAAGTRKMADVAGKVVDAVRDVKIARISADRDVALGHPPCSDTRD